MKKNLLKRRLAMAILTMLLGAAFVPTASAQSRGTLSSDFEDQSIPSDWNNDANRPWTITNADNHTDQGSYCLKSYSGVNGATSDLEASVLSLQAGTITFWAKISSESNYDKGYFYIDDEVLIDGISGDGDWIEYNFDLAAGMHTLKWSYEKDGSAADYQDCFFIDDITITNVATCPSVSGIAIGNVTQNSAVLSWVDNGVGNYQVSCNTSPGAPSVHATTTGTTYTLTDLSYGTAYYVAVRSNCGDEQGVWSNELCVVAGSNLVTTTTVKDGTSTNEFVPIYGYYADNSTFSLFMLPESDLELLEDGFINGLTFYANNNLDFGGDRWKVYVKITDEDFPTSFNENVYNTMTEVYEGTVTIGSNHEMNIGFNTSLAYTNGNLWIGFKQTYSDESYSHSYWYGVEEGTSWGGYGTSAEEQTFTPKTTISYLPSLTPKPINLAISEMGINDATLTWNELGTATAWEVGYSTTAGNYSTIVNANATNVTIGNLVQGMRYYVAVRANYGGGIYSDWSNELSFAAGVRGLTLNDGTTTNDFVPVYGYYADNNTRSLFMLQAEDLADMAYGNLTSFTFYGYGDDNAQDIAWGNDQWTVYVKETIDEFPSEYNEEIFESMTAVYSGSLAIVNGKMTINLNQSYLYQGDNLWVGIYQTNTDGSCPRSYWYGVEEGTSFGGYEGNVHPYTFQPKVTLDYEIGIVPSCLPVTNLAIEDTEGHSVTLSWTDVNDATAWQIEYGLKGFAQGNGTIVTVSTNPATVDGLAIGTMYDFYVRAVCDAENSDYSFWSEAISAQPGHVFEIPANSHLVVEECGALLVDNGGEDNVYADNSDGYVVITPGYRMLASVSGTFETEQNYDFIRIYDGESTDEADLIAEYSGSGTIPPTTSTHGKLTVRFVSDVSTGLSGFKIVIDCVEAPCLTPIGLDINSITQNEATLTWTGYSDSYNISLTEMNCPVDVDFETGNFNQDHFTTTDSYPWTVVANDHSGAYCAKSHSGANDQISALELRVNLTENMTLTFSAKVSSEAGYDKASFYIDGYVQPDLNGISGEDNDWIDYSYSLVAGAHTLSWEYTKDGSGNNGDDSFYVDDIRISAEATSSTNYTSNTNSYHFANLNAGRVYKVQVQGVCGSETTEWTASKNFTTAYTPFPKTIEGYGNGDGKWYLIASPLDYSVTPTQVDGMVTDELGSNVTPETSTFDLYRFDQTQELEWLNYRDEPFNLVSGQGYLYANKNNVTLSFTGKPYSGNGDVELTYSDVNESEIMRGLNLVGNPFAVTATPSCDYLEMNANGTEIIVGEDFMVEPMEGIFVYASADDPTMSFSPAESKSANKRAGLTLNVAQGRGLADRAVVRFGGNHTLPKFQLDPSHTKVYIPQEGKDYAVVTAESNMGEMPVNFKAEKKGTYTLSANAEGVSFSYLHLIDNMTGADIDLLQQPYYTFEANTIDYASRFRLVFVANDTDGSSTSSETFGFYSNGNFVIANEGDATLQVVDINGRILKSETISGCASINVDAASGVYMLRLINGTDVKVQKIVVK